jgi:hypothetical protein
LLRDASIGASGAEALPLTDQSHPFTAARVDPNVVLLHALAIRADEHPGG